jgi:hypothetical protein
LILFRVSEDDHKRLDEELEKNKLAEMEAEAKKARERSEALRIFEGLSHKIENGEPWFDIPSPAEPMDKNKNKYKDREEKSLPVFPTCKYSKPGLYESVIVGGLPFFIKYDAESDEIMVVEKIVENSRILRPPDHEEYPYSPYEFVDAAELSEYASRAINETIDSLYQKALGIVKLFNDQDNYKQSIITIDLVWSYFQDKFGTTHYLGVTGDNDSGKSSIGNTFEAVGYRCVNMTSPSAPNIFRVLGMIEPGQCTLVLDEADKIDNDIDIMNILKTGYDYSKRVPKTNTNTWKLEFFWTYCFKIIIGEKSLSRFKAKGLLDRTLSFSVFPGEASLDIKEVMNPQGDPELEQALGRLLDFRKLMLVYRLLHFNDPVIDLDIGLKRRNRELCKPYIRLFYGTESQKEIEYTFQTLIDLKNSRKAKSIEAILIPVIVDLVEENGNELSSNVIWNYVTENLEGQFPYGSTNEYHIEDHILYRNTITKILEDKFGAEPPKDTRKGNVVILNMDKLRKLQKSYESDTDIKIETRKKNVLECEGSEGSEGSREKASLSNNDKSVENLNNSVNNEEHTSASTQNTILKELERQQAFLQDPSHPSHPSHPSPSESGRLLFSYKCYHPNCDFQTNNIGEYERHGALKHLENPLLYPSRYEIEKYGLTPQGKEWEV